MEDTKVDTLVNRRRSDASGEVLSQQGSMEDGTVEELGYVPVYRRVLKSVVNMCMVVSLTSPLLAVLLTGFYQISYAGYWGLTWGWIIPNLLMLPQVLAIGELASSMPVNGAFYWWTGALAPPSWSHAVSFITGWMNIFSLFSATASFAYAVSSSFSYGLNLVLPDMEFTNAELMALGMAVMFVWAALMGLKLENIAIVYISMALLVLVQTLIFVFGLPITHRVQDLPFASGKDVFGSFSTYTNWGVSVALPTSWFAGMWVNSAWMVPVYVAEETHRASTEIPKSLIMTFSLTAISGFVICLISAFCITDIDYYGSDESGYPLIDLLVAHWGSKLTGGFLLSMAPVGFIGGSGTLLTYACQIAAFARDGGFPWSHKMSSVHSYLNLPIYSVAFLSTGTFLILLFSLSPEASNIIYSLAVVAGLITFLTPVIFRIWAGDRWVPGPFSLGRWSIPVHIFVTISQSYIIMMECFPADAKWDALTLNYNFAVTLGSIFLSVVLYWCIGKQYRGLDMEALAIWRRAHGVHVESQGQS